MREGIVRSNARPGRSKRRARLGSTEPKGAVQIEFALAILTVLFLIFATWEIIMIVHTMNVLSDAAKEGVRYAIVHGGGNINCSGPNPSDKCTNPDPSAQRVVDKVKEYATFSFHDISAINVTVSYPDNSSEPPSRVRVEVAYVFVPYTALPFKPTLRSAAEGRIVN